MKTRSWLSWLVLLPAVSLTGLAEAPAELWVRAQLAAGRNADLATYAPSDLARRVPSAGFLANVLSAKKGMPNGAGSPFSTGS